MNLLYAFPEPLPLPRARGLQVVNTVRALAEQGMAVDLCHVPGGSDPFEASDLARPQNVRLTPLSRSLPWPLDGMHSNRYFAMRLARYIDEQPPDAIMVRHLKIAQSLLRRFPRIPLLYEAHEVFADTAPARRQASIAALERRVVQGAQAVVSNSRATAERLTQRYGSIRKLAVIPNGVDFRSLIPEKDWSRCGERIVYAGSFFGWKGVDDLVAAARELPGLHISLLGGDEDSICKMRGQAKAGGAELEFAGRVSPQRVAQALENACIAVLPNRDDLDSVFTSPIKLFEYMAAGCAIVACDLPAVREILAEDEAVWVRPGDPHSLAAGLRRLVADTELARAMSARVRVKARRYTWAQRAVDLARVLHALAVVA
jgi:glycosyltransferase involved in cell wall biosynthesis